MPQAALTPKRLTIAAVAAFLVAIAWLGFAPSANAGTYLVWECAASSGGPAAAPDLGNNNLGFPTGGGDYLAYNDCSNGSPNGAFPYAFGFQAFEVVGTGQYKAWDFIAPPGTRFLNGSAELNMVGVNGHQPIASIGNQSFLQQHIATSTNGWQNVQWAAADGSTNQFVLWLVCAHGGGACPAAQGWTISYARNLVFNVQDYTAPGASVGGSLTGGGWRNSGGTLSVGGSDSGAGVYFVDQYINGGHVSRAFNSDCATIPFFGASAGTRLTPCSTGHSNGNSFGTGSFQQGANTYQGCAYDFAADGNYNGTCAAETVYIDTVAPEAVGGLSVGGGSGWRPTNDFDLSWSNPGQAHAPIDGYYYRLTKVGGGYDSGAQYVSGAATSRPDVSVPSMGEYQMKIWLRDSAGNQSESNAQTTTLRYDPTVPPASEAQYNGWVRRNDFDHEAEWEPVPAGQLGPSGLDGYAVSVTQDPTSDPCVTDAHPSSSCSATEVNNDGIGDTEMPVASKPEGDWYIHVVPVTGAGVKSGVKHTPMPVDTTDPTSSVEGASGEWTNKDVQVSISGSDALSGMAPNPAITPDPQPRTCLQVDGATADCEPDADLTRVISGEGNHTVAYFARDLAGNENSGGQDPQYAAKTNNPPNTAAVRIDKTAPTGVFSSSRDVNDPSKVVVTAGDNLSGARRRHDRAKEAGLEWLLVGAGDQRRRPDSDRPGSR